MLSENHGNQYLEDFYTHKYQKHVACSCIYKLACIDDKFNKPLKTYLSKDAVYHSINDVIIENKCCSEVMKKHFKNELVMTKENNEVFKNSAKCWIYDNDYIDTDVKVRGHCHITGKYRGSARRDCNINLKLNQKLPAEFHSLKSYDFHLIMRELCKFNLKISVMPNGLEKYMSIAINNKLCFIDSFQFLSS